jgi:hypothetical protein
VILDCQDTPRMHALARALKAAGWPSAAKAVHTFAKNHDMPSTAYAHARLREVPPDILAAIPEARPSKPMTFSDPAPRSKRQQRSKQHG